MTSSASLNEAALWQIRRLCNLTVAGIWVYQGVVPKLLGPHADELAMSNAFGVPSDLQPAVSYAAGAGELMVGLLIVLLPNRAWPQILSAVATAVLLAFVAVYAPSYLLGAFNPVVMNGASISLSLVALIALRAELPR